MRIVIDLGCAGRDAADSLAVLAEEYSPDIIYGFDPSRQLLHDVRHRIGDADVVLERKAAWVVNGEISFCEDGSASRIGPGSMVEVFDFSDWLRRLQADEIIVKMDIEGAEVPVLRKMVADGTDLLVDELLVEWHYDEHDVKQEVEVRCPVREWWL